MNNFSPNMLKTYDNCPKKFYYQYVEKINSPKSSLPFEKGKKIHALANYFLRGINISRLEESLTVSEKEVWDLLLNNQFFQKDYLKSEFPLYSKVAQYWIGGRIDAIVHQADEYYILDYKTGSIPENPEFDYQTMVYLLCVDKFLKKYDKLSFVYIDLKNNNNLEIKFNETLKVKYQDKIEKICNQITSDTLYECNRKNCSRCEYSKFCD